MKNKFFLAGLTISLLLASCCSKGDGIPTKAKYSHEVTFSEFDEKLDNLFGDDFSIDTDVSFVSNSRIVFDTYLNLFDEDNTNIGTAHSRAKCNYSGKYDGKTDVSYVATTGSEETVIDYNGEKTSEKDKGSFARKYQSFEDESSGETKTVSVNNKNKEYYIVGKYDDNEPALQAMKVIALPLLFYGLGTMNFETQSQASKDKWKFYIDKGIFTAVYSEITTREKSEYIDGESVKYADVEKEEVNLVQFQGKKSKDKLESISCYFEMISTEKTSFVATHEDDGVVFTAGQTLMQNSSSIFGIKVTVKDVSLTPVDLSGYTDKETDEESEKYDILY